MRAARWAGLGAVAAAAMATVWRQPAMAHGSETPEPSLPGLLTSWSFDPLPLAGGLVAIGAYLAAAARVNRAHPRTPVPTWRIVAWISGVLVALAAVLSSLDAYADALLSAHMIQHLLLAMVAPPLLLLGAPITLLLRVASPAIRRDLILPVLHSRVVGVIAFPPVAWSVFAIAMWVTHFTPLYNAALEDPFLHELEHVVYLAAGLLFWWPIVGADPHPRRMGHAGRVVYLLAQMPVGAAVGLAIYFAPDLLYAHYATNELAWGPDPLTDQQIAGAIMWGVGGLILLAGVAALIAGWIRTEERRSRRAEGRPALPVD